MRLLPSLSLARPLVACPALPRSTSLLAFRTRIAPPPHSTTTSTSTTSRAISTTPRLPKSSSDIASPVSVDSFWQLMDADARDAHERRHPKKRPRPDEWLRPEGRRGTWQGEERGGGDRGGRGGGRGGNWQDRGKQKRGGGQRGGQQRRGQKSKREKGIQEGSSDDVLRFDIEELVERLRAERGLGQQEQHKGEATESAQAVVDKMDEAIVSTAEDEVAPETTVETTAEPAIETTTTEITTETTLDATAETTIETPTLPPQDTIIDVEILELSSAGDGLGVHAGSPPGHIYVVPFSLPGDVVRAHVWEHLPAESHSHADFVSVVTPSDLRDDSRVKCQYFSKCSGCQFQMLDYAEQLRIKRRVLERAFARFSKLDPAAVPAVGDTIGSPVQYGYRTKLTPHFHGPPGHPGPRRDGRDPHFDSCPDVGYMVKGRRKVMDIEDCPIGTDAVRAGMASERARMQVEFAKYQRGATILLRETTDRHSPKSAAPPPENDPAGAVRVDGPDHVDVKSVITKHSEPATEYIDSHVFTSPAGSFFQNNNSILPSFTSFVRSHILPPPDSGIPIKYLIDAYSGSGLFTITLSSLFQGSTGIDIDVASIASATRNAAANGIPPSQATFIAADATTRLFASVTYPPDETVVVLDPPRKGCDPDFLAQLLRFGPRRVLYVSCNVHTQARDIGALVRGEGGDGRTRYEIESLRGFDFFPQTHHVEGVAVLNRVVDDQVEMASSTWETYQG